MSREGNTWRQPTCENAPDEYQSSPTLVSSDGKRTDFSASKKNEPADSDSGYGSLSVASDFSESVDFRQRAKSNQGRQRLTPDQRLARGLKHISGEAAGFEANISSTSGRRLDPLIDSYNDSIFDALDATPVDDAPRYSAPLNKKEEDSRKPESQQPTHLYGGVGKERQYDTQLEKRPYEHESEEESINRLQRIMEHLRIRPSNDPKFPRDSTSGFLDLVFTLGKVAHLGMKIVATVQEVKAYRKGVSFESAIRAHESSLEEKIKQLDHLIDELETKPTKHLSQKDELDISLIELSSDFRARACMLRIYLQDVSRISRSDFSLKAYITQKATISKCQQIPLQMFSDMLKHSGYKLLLDLPPAVHSTDSTQRQIDNDPDDRLYKTVEGLRKSVEGLSMNIIDSRTVDLAVKSTPVKLVTDNPSIRKLDSGLGDETTGPEEKAVWGYLVPCDGGFGPALALEESTASSLPMATRLRPYVIGRHAKCDQVIDNQYVSERQYTVFAEERRGRKSIKVSSLSDGGTFVNKAFLGKNYTRELQDGDEIGILDVAKCVFHTQESYPFSRNNEKEHDKGGQTAANKNVSVRTTANRNNQALIDASAKGHGKLVEVLLNRGAAINTRCNFYESALIAASSKGHTAIVKILLRREADVNISGEFYGRESALTVASREGHEDIVEILLEWGADVNLGRGSFCNALTAASRGGHDSIVKTLLYSGADVNAGGVNLDVNALSAAYEGGYEGIVKILPEWRADFKVPRKMADGKLSEDGELTASSKRRHENILQMLLARAHPRHGTALYPEPVQEFEKTRAYDDAPEEQFDDVAGEQSDDASVASLGISSIFSSASITSSSTSGTVMSLLDGCLDAILKHEIVVKLGDEAASKIDMERFERNVGRLLGLFSRDLYDEATFHTQKRAAKSLSATVRYVAAQISSRFYTKPKKATEYARALGEDVSDMKLDVSDVKTEVSDVKVDVGDVNMDVSDAKIPERFYSEHERQPFEAQSESESEDEGEADPAFDLTFVQVRTFVMDGEPFKQFLANLKAFVDPPELNAAQSLKAAVVTPADALNLIRSQQIPTLISRPTYLDRQAVQPGSILYWHEGEIEFRQWKDGRRWNVIDENEDMVTSEEIMSESTPKSDPDTRLVRRDLTLTDGDGRVSHMVSYLSKCDALNEHLMVPSAKPDSSVKPDFAPSQAPFKVVLQNGLDRLTRRPPLSGKRRIEWTCSCGRRIYDDYTELQPGALETLQVRLDKRANVSYRSNENAPRSNRRAGARGLTSIPSLLSSFFSKTSGKDREELPSHEDRSAHSSKDNVTTSEAQPVFDHLLLLFPHRTYASKVDQPTSCGINSDLEFFTRIKARYNSLCHKIRNHLSLRALVEVRFVQFQLRRNALANTIKLDSLPPLEESDNYNYKPMPPEFLPPIGSNEMLHYLDHPGDLLPGADMFSQVPKKLREKLQICPDKGYGVGWGIQFVEGVSYKRISVLAFASISISTVVAIIWAAITKDTQTAFTVGTYVLMVFASAIGSLQTVLEK